jgi:hypothetical protein
VKREELKKKKVQRELQTKTAKYKNLKQAKTKQTLKKKMIGNW